MSVPSPVTRADRQSPSSDTYSAEQAHSRRRGPTEAAHAEPGPFLTPFRELIHNISQFGEHWSWRCGVAYSRLDPGYVDGACRYDHTVGSWEQLVSDATEHLSRWHDIHLADSDPAGPAA